MKRMVTWFHEKLQDKRVQVAVTTGGLTVFSAFPSLAADPVAGDLGTFTTTLTTLAAWLWNEVGLFCSFVLAQPMLMLALSIPFVGMIVNFFLRIFKSV